MPLPLAGLAALAANTYRAVQTSRALAGAAGVATQVRLVNSHVSRNPGSLPSASQQTQSISKGLQQKQNIQSFLNRNGQSGLISQNQISRLGKALADLKYKQQLGQDLMKAAKWVEKETWKQAAKSVPRAAAEAGVVGALATGGDLIIGGDNNNNPAGPRGRRPRKKPRNKDPYKPDEPEDENEEELDDNTDDTSCLDDSGDMPVNPPPDKMDITLYTPYGTVSTTR